MKPWIGITERGDAAIDFIWEAGLPTVNGAVLITKNPGNDKFQDAIMRNVDKVFLHATITGNGGTVYEPNVPTYQKSLNGLEKLIARGFPADRIVLRCDPIIPTREGLLNAHAMLKDFVARDLKIPRIRVSVLDNYFHVQKRFMDAGLPVLYDGEKQPREKELRCVSNMLHNALHGTTGIRVVACAEPELVKISETLGNIPIKEEGCIGEIEAKAFGINIEELVQRNRQRPYCKCLPCKKELLSRRGRCPHRCLYCYWWD